MKKEKVEIIKRPVKRFGFNKTNPKKAAWSAVFESVVTIALGVLLVIWPNTIVRVVAYLVGACLLVKGGYKIVNYMLERQQNNGMNNDLIIGIMTFVVGAVIFVMGDAILDVFRVIAGIWIIYEALIRMSNAMRIRTVNSTTWSAVLTMSIIMLMFGIFITFFDGAVVFLIGWLMIVVGLIGLTSDVIFMQNLSALVEKLKGNTK